MTAAVSTRRGCVRIETCAGSWLIDTQRRQYCRVERGTAVTFVPPLAWLTFYSLSIGDGGLVRLVLDERGGSAVSGWLHDGDCVRCGQGARKLA